MDLEDKLLGYKAQNYVSSSESEGEDDEDSGRESGGEAKNKNAEETPQLDLRVDGPMVKWFIYETKGVFVVSVEICDFLSVH